MQTWQCAQRVHVRHHDLVSLIKSIANNETLVPEMESHFLIVYIKGMHTICLINVYSYQIVMPNMLYQKQSTRLLWTIAHCQFLNNRFFFWQLIN
jgi:hypothetical protein